MLAKCANPACSTSFRRLNEGKLFQVESQLTPNDANTRALRREGAARRIEHFWLCSECCRFVTLAVNENTGVITVPLPESELIKTVRVIDPGRKPPLPEIRPEASDRTSLPRYRS
jgi:hypothetical protein